MTEENEYKDFSKAQFVPVFILSLFIIYTGFIEVNANWMTSGVGGFICYGFISVASILLTNTKSTPEINIIYNGIVALVSAVLAGSSAYFGVNAVTQLSNFVR